MNRVYLQVYNLIPYLLFLCATFFICCSTRKNDIEYSILDINMQDTFDQVDIVDVIQLESNDSSICGSVSRIERFDNKIYILDKMLRNTLLVFDAKGSYINHLKTGKGPGECLSPFDFYIDKSKNKLVLFDYSLQRLSTYDLNLNFIEHIYEEQNDKWMKWNSFDKLNNNQWIVYSNSDVDYSGEIFSYHLYDIDFQLQKEFLQLPSRDHHKLSIYNPISRENYEQVYCQPFDQNIYTFDNEEFRTKYYLDFGEYSLTEQESKEMDIYEVYSLMQKKERIILLGDLIHSKNYFAASFNLDRREEYFIYSKNENIIQCSPNSSVLPRGLLKGMWDENTFILVVLPSNFKDYLSNHQNYSMEFNTDDLQDGGNFLLVLFKINN